MHRFNMVKEYFYGPKLDRRRRLESGNFAVFVKISSSNERIWKPSRNSQVFLRQRTASKLFNAVLGLTV